MTTSITNEIPITQNNYQHTNPSSEDAASSNIQIFDNITALPKKLGYRVENISNNCGAIPYVGLPLKVALSFIGKLLKF